MNATVWGGSVTALPVVETLLGDIAAFIPTNLISITDGQIYLEVDYFFRGVRPAVNTSLSLSRVGGSCQSPILKTVSEKLRVELALFREVEGFVAFGADLDAGVLATLTRGFRIVEVLKQDREVIYSVLEQVLLVIAVTGGFFDSILQKNVKKATNFLIKSVHTDKLYFQHLNLSEKRINIELLRNYIEMAMSEYEIA